MIHVQNPEDPDKVFYLGVDGESSRFRISSNRDSFVRARDSAISFAWKRRIETFFPRTSTLILNENEPLAKSLCRRWDESERHDWREIRRSWRGYEGTRNSGGRGCRQRTMNARELFHRLWPRAPNYALNIVVLKLSLLFTMSLSFLFDVRFWQSQSRRLNARSPELTCRKYEFLRYAVIEITNS